MKKISLLIILFCLLGCRNNYIKNMEPIIEYSNYGGYSYSENEKYIIIEAIYNGKNDNEKPELLGYLKKEIRNGITVKTKIYNDNTLFIEEIAPFYLTVEELKEKVDKITLVDNGVKELSFNNGYVRLDYQSNDIINAIIKVEIINNKKKIQFEVDGLYQWAFCTHDKLIICIIGSGGSGHTVSIKVYGLN